MMGSVGAKCKKVGADDSGARGRIANPTSESHAHRILVRLWTRSFLHNCPSVTSQNASCFPRQNASWYVVQHLFKSFLLERFCTSCGTNIFNKLFWIKVNVPRTKAAFSITLSISYLRHDTLFSWLSTLFNTVHLSDGKINLNSIKFFTKFFIHIRRANDWFC